MLANELRCDVRAAGINDGRCGFRLDGLGLNPLLAQAVRVRRIEDGAELTGSPAMLIAAVALDPGVRQAIQSSIAATAAAAGTAGLIIPLLAAAYPDIRLLTHEQVIEQHVAEQAYATYSLGLFFDDAECNWQPTDFRHVGLHRPAAYILGVDPAEQPPRLAFDDPGPPIPEPYAVIAVQSSSGCKYWTNPHGWRETILFLKAHGYRVICIDQKPVHGDRLMWTSIPHGAEDETGDRPLAERARWLKHARLFVGLSSGLAWLAWATGTPVVLISGFTHPTNEFTTPYRVINWHACNSCWNDPKHRFNHHDFLWCPRHQGTPRHFECTRLITPDQVTQVIARIPGFEATTPNLKTLPSTPTRSRTRRTAEP